MLKQNKLFYVDLAVLLGTAILVGVICLSG